VKSTLLPALCLTIAFAGCAQLDEMNKQALERREASRKVQDESSQLRLERCQVFDYAATKDVDTVYASAVSRFGLRTPEERRKAAVNPGYQMRGDTYVYNAQPGALYRISDWANVPGFPSRESWVRINLAKQGSATAVNGYICWEAEPGPARRQAALSTIRATL
jgi:hypothetical protein